VGLITMRAERSDASYSKPSRFYHASSLPGRDHLRCLEAAELHYDTDGTIRTANP
jgi:hypothetical protein